MQAITTKYQGPTNNRDSRIKAECEAGSVYVSWDYGIGYEENHAAARDALVNKLGWTVENGYRPSVWHTGQMKCGTYAHVNVITA